MKPSKVIKIIALIFLNIIVAYTFSFAEWTKKEIEKLTDEIRQYDKNWSLNKTTTMLNSCDKTKAYNGVFDKFNIIIAGENTILINGKSIGKKIKENFK